MPFLAKYAGRCAAGDSIEPGDELEYVDDVLVHVGCKPREDTDDKPSKFQGTSLEEMGY